jgi:cytochrome c oxidase subunit IV
MDHAETTGTTADHHVDLKKHVRTYIIVFVSLMALTLVTVAISYLDLPFAAAVGLGLLVATIKGSLVACYFMHLISERKLIYVVMALTVFMFIGVLVGPVLTELDEIHP